MEELIFTVGFWLSPLLVVIKITPAEPLKPYTAADAASFNTVTDSISSGLTAGKGRTIPSTTTKTFPSPFPAPRTINEVASFPGCPLFCVATKPGNRPCSIVERLEDGAFCNSAELTCTTEPVTLIFFCVPYPTTTTSSSKAASSSNVTLIVVLFPTFTSWVAIPIKEKIRVLF